MTVRKTFRDAVLTVIEAQVTGLQVTAGHAAEDSKLRETVWVMRAESDFEWRSLGTGAQLLKNRTEEIRLEIGLRVYREGPDQLAAQTAALDRCEDLIGEIEAAIAPDPGVAGVVSYARVARSSVTPRSAGSGWVADGDLQLLATNHP